MNDQVYYPNFESFRALAQGADSVPVFTELVLDTETPVSAFAKIHRGGPAFLLESIDGGETWGRYSLLASGARAMLTVRGDLVSIEENGSRRTHRTSAPLAAIHELLARRRPAEVQGVPRFAGGAVGFLSYDLVRRFERLPSLARDDLDLPEVQLVIAETVAVFDNLHHTVKVIHNAQTGDNPAAAYERAIEAIDRTVALLTGPAPELHPVVGLTARATEVGAQGFESSMGETAFGAGVEQLREAILAGEAIQVVLSHRLSRRFEGDPFDVYRALRVVNPSPYMFFLDFGSLHVVGASPEVLVRVEGERMVVRPIAGTRPRGRDGDEDRRLEAELRADPKERAEHLMLVDLGRNDVGRVARYGSVGVRDFMVVERYSHVMHLVSEVHGRLEPGCGCLDALRAAFPAGTVSGAPKVRAMELIETLEPVRRGVYAGAVGYFDFQGNMDTCIAIRTLLVRDGWGHLQVGAGIVADSRPELEWQETMHKAGALLRAMAMADAVLPAGPSRARGDTRARRAPPAE